MARGNRNSRFELEGLEPRVMLSADMAPGAASLAVSLSSLVDEDLPEVELALEMPSESDQTPSASSDEPSALLSPPEFDLFEGLTSEDIFSSTGEDSTSEPAMSE